MTTRVVVDTIRYASPNPCEVMVWAAPWNDIAIRRNMKEPPHSQRR